MPRKGTRNAQGSGNTRQRPDGRWEARITMGRDPGTGKQKQVSIYGKTQKEVLQKQHSMTVKRDTGEYIEPSKLTVGQWLDIWKSEYLGAVKPSTQEQYGMHIRVNIKPAFGAVRLEALNTPTIQKLYNTLQRREKPLSPKSIHNLHGVLHKALKQAVRLGHIRYNPAEACILPRVEQTETAHFEENALKSFLMAIKGHKYERLYLIDVFTGMREGEILGLTWDSVDFEHGTVTISRQLQKERKKGGVYILVSLKNDKARRISPAPSVMQVLKEQRQDQLQWRLKCGGQDFNPMNLIFTNEDGGHLAKATVYNCFKRIVNDIGIPEARFHDMRHTYAMLSLQNGDDPKTLQQNLGHATVSFTLDKYGHVSERMKQESANRMEAFIGSVKG